MVMASGTLVSENDWRVSVESDELLACQRSRCGRMHRARGAVMVEYSVLIGTVALGASLALVGLGVAFVRSFEFVRGFILYPFP